MTPSIRCRKALLGLIVAAIAGACQYPAFAWSREGHSAVAMIAANLLKGTHTQERLAAILGGDSLASISLCPDEVRAFLSRHDPMSTTCATLFADPPTGTDRWHFVNIPIKDGAFNPGRR